MKNKSRMGCSTETLSLDELWGFQNRGINITKQQMWSDLSKMTEGSINPGREIQTAYSAQCQASLGISMSIRVAETEVGRERERGGNIYSLGLCHRVRIRCRWWELVVLQGIITKLDILLTFLTLQRFATQTESYFL